nr:LysR substrate-binding domain-containing protein [Actinomadura sp. NBRC 104425]
MEGGHVDPGDAEQGELDRHGAGVRHRQDAERAQHPHRGRGGAAGLGGRRRAPGRPRGAVAASAGESFVLFPRALGPGLHEAITRATRAAGFEPRVAQEAVQMQTIVGLVAAGLGVSIVPAAVARVRRAEVVFRRLTPPAEGVPLLLVWRRGDTSPVVRNFRDVATG